MTEGKLNELETICSVEADQDGRVRLYAADVLELVNELRERRKHAADLRAHEGAIANLHRLLAGLSRLRGRFACRRLGSSGHIAIQDPGR